MKKETLLLLLLALLLLAGMIYTLVAGGDRSRHGYGLGDDHPAPPAHSVPHGKPVNTGSFF